MSMKKAFFLTGLGMLAAPLGAASVEPPALAPAPAPAPAAGPAPAPAPAQAPAPTPEEIEASRAAAGSADIERLFTDRAYAASILAHLDRLAPALEGNSEARLATDNMRLIALITQERPEDVRAGIDMLLAQQPTEGRFYYGAWLSAISIRDFDRAVAVAETASRNVPGVGWARLRPLFDREMVSPVLGRLHQDHQEDMRVRLAQALFRIGWPGSEDAGTADYIRSILMADRLRQHDDAGAASYAEGMVTPDQIVRMVVQTRYDPVLAPGRDRIALLADSLAQRDRATSEALAVAPQNMARVLDRAQLLRSLGRNADALALIMPFTRDVAATVAAGAGGKWLINEGGYALLALGRNDQAVALMRRLANLPIARDPTMVSQFINHAEILVDVGLYAEALDRARRLERDDAQYASDYGKMWISAAVVCALAGLSRSAEAAPELAHMRTLSDTNPAALTRAYLCVGDDNAAAALMVHRLEGEDPESAILALQNYALSDGAGQEGPLFARLTALRDRPEVRDALARVGHVLTLPVARTYWGGF
jgi:tetratricopeptide (TPR) repeat protein